MFRSLTNAQTDISLGEPTLEIAEGPGGHHSLIGV
jgi:hypothetical protein